MTPAGVPGFFYEDLAPAIDYWDAIHLRKPDCMSRYRGRQNAKAVEQDFPHFVDVVVPPGGLGIRLDAMYEFHARRGIRARRGHGRHDADGSVVRWCFADSAIAAAFAKEFQHFRIEHVAVFTYH